MNRKPMHYNQLMEAIRTDNQFKLTDRPTIGINLFKKPIMMMFGGAEKMQVNVIKALILLDYLEQDKCGLFKVKNWSVG